MIKVRRLGHATLATPDLAGQIAHYSGVLGLHVAEQSAERAILVTSQGVEAIELVTGGAVTGGAVTGGGGQLQRLSFQITPGSDLDEVVKTLQAMGIAAERRRNITPAIAEAVTLSDPNGIQIDLFADYRFYQPARPGYFNILKLGHVAYHVRDLQQVVKFYADVLGFRESDWRGDFFVFLRCNTDHHALNFVTDETPRLHHIAFEVVDWSEVNKIGDWLARNDTHLVWGPGRHIIGHNVATYHNTADGVRVEIFTELDQIKDEELGYFEPRPWHQQVPLYPKTHGPETLRNYWGFASQGPIKG